MHQQRRTQGERTAQTRRRLIDAAIERLMAHGMAGATVIEICRAAEVTTGALQHQFGSKNGLMSAVVGALFRPFTEILKPLDPAAPLTNRIELLVDHYWGIYSDERYCAVLEILLASRHDPDLMAMVSKFRLLQLDMLSDGLARDFPDVELPPAEMVQVVHRALDLMRGYIVHRMFERSETLDAEIRAEARILVERRFRPALAKGVH